MACQLGFMNIYCCYYHDYYYYYVFTYLFRVSLLHCCFAIFMCTALLSSTCRGRSCVSSDMTADAHGAPANQNTGKGRAGFRRHERQHNCSLKDVEEKLRLANAFNG